MDTQAQIISLLNQRSEQAIHEMNVAYGGLCRHIAGNILSSAEDIEEVLNDTMFATWNNIPPQQPISLSAYLCRIARNLSLAKLRNQTAMLRNERLKICLSELENCIPAPETPQSQLEYKQLTQSINTYLSTVSKINRFIFIRRYFYLDSCKEIAKQASLTEQAIRTRLMRIRNDLRKHLQKEGLL